MAGKFPESTLTVIRRDGRTERWRFELAADASLEEDKLKPSLIKEFVGADVPLDQFQLRIGGTAASPEFILKETDTVVTRKTRVE